MTDLVLLHGTTQSADGFAELVDELERAGHRALTVRIPSGAATTSVEYAELLAGQLPALDRPVVVAHSASGLLLPALAGRLSARLQVWLAGPVADFATGRSFLDEVRADPSAVLQPDWLGVDPTSDQVLATHFLFHDANLTRLRAGLATLAPCDLSAVYAEVPVVDPRHRPCAYLLPAQDRTLRPDWMERVSRERLGIEPIMIEGGHNCYVAFPEQVAMILDGLGRH